MSYLSDVSRLKKEKAIPGGLFLFAILELSLKTSRAAHFAMVAGLLAGFNSARLFFFEEVYELGDDGLFDAKSLLTGMRGGRVDACKPG